MKKVGIVLDSWKLPIFKKILGDAGYEYERHEGPGVRVITLTIQTESIAKLQPFVKKANDEAAKSKRRKRH